jgi:hypothetical protein
VGFTLVERLGTFLEPSSMWFLGGRLCGVH